VIPLLKQKWNMEDKSKFTDSKFAWMLEGAEGRAAIRQTWLEHLVLRDFFRDSVAALVDKGTPYIPIDSWDFMKNSRMKNDSDSEYLNNSFSQASASEIHGMYENHFNALKSDIALIDDYIRLFELDPDVTQIQYERRELIMRIEELAISIIQRSINGTVLKEDISRKLFLDSILDCFSNEDDSQAISDLNLIKSRIHLRLSSWKKEHSQLKRTPNFNASNYSINL